MTKANIHITLKNGVLDPQGKAIAQALESLGFKGVKEVRQGKYIEVVMDEKSGKKVERLAGDMCEKLLANTVIENYSVSVEE